ncbi:3-oxoacyl-[acyl-carrier protein] reductase [hydrothermal vent metagenome]|uniref:3-oxoacyl-[acyl-carrier protein] reductase n=1 Tax=hydrothermal vent metagenome TaxID=652676 RepID=A0A3B0S9R3_9ZZZZ
MSSIRNLFDIKGKVALVTGGATSIGLGIAEVFAESGANIAICSRRGDLCKNVAKEIARHGVETFGAECDVSSPDSVAEMVDAVIEKFGRIDILVNNAGITGAAKPFRDIEYSEWNETLAINLGGIFNCSKLVVPHMIAQGGGKIINIASVAFFKPLPNSADYSASKGGAILLTRSMALDLIRNNINVNAICPGFFATDLNTEMLARVKVEAKRRVPAQRVADVRDIKGAALLLASQASDYMVGTEILVDGGVRLR